MNNEAINKLLEHLKEQRDSDAAARFNMKFFGHPTGEYGVEDMLTMPTCHTQACLGGEALLANGVAYIPKGGGIEVREEFRAEMGRDIESAAVQVLGLTGEQRAHLFYFTRWIEDEGYVGWPQKFEQAYHEAITPAARLQVAIERVQHFLETDGAE